MNSTRITCQHGALLSDCDRCAEMDAAFRRGLREGVAIAKEHARPRFYNSDRCNAVIDWTDADAELERRLGGKERGDV